MADELIITPSEVKLGPGPHRILRSLNVIPPNGGESIKAGTLMFRNAPSERDYGAARAEGIGGPLGSVVAGMALADAAPGQPVDIVESGIVIIGPTAAPVQAEGYFLAPFVGPVAGLMAPIDDIIFFAGQFRSFVAIGLADGQSILLQPSSSGIQIP